MIADYRTIEHMGSKYRLLRRGKNILNESEVSFIFEEIIDPHRTLVQVIAEATSRSEEGYRADYPSIAKLYDTVEERLAEMEKRINLRDGPTPGKE